MVKLAVSDKNLRVLDDNGNLVAEYTIGHFGSIWPRGTMISHPPPGCYRVLNLYYDPSIKKVVMEVDNSSVP